LRSVRRDNEPPVLPGRFLLYRCVYRLPLFRCVYRLPLFRCFCLPLYPLLCLITGTLTCWLESGKIANALTSETALRIFLAASSAFLAASSVFLAASSAFLAAFLAARATELSTCLASVAA